MVVQELAYRWDVSFEMGPVALSGSVSRRGEELKLVLPQTFMNLSGDAVAGLVQPPVGENLIVAYDDLDLPPGVLRLRRDGGAGGHRGVESIIERCGSTFVRVRVGIGRPPLGMGSSDYVLGEFPDDERNLWANVVERAADAVECVLTDGLQVAMNRFNATEA